MAEFDVEVVGTRPPKKPERLLKRLLRFAVKSLRKMVMRPRTIMFLGLAGFVLLVGTPHVGWDYGCNESMGSGHSCHYVSYCAYYGIQGRRIVHPAPGESCQLVTVLPLDWGQII